VVVVGGGSGGTWCVVVSFWVESGIQGFAFTNDNL
jgi:hypothetical protein